MHTPRRTSVAAAALATAGALFLTACGSGGGAPAAAPGGPTTLTVGLFGTFGFKEIGLFDEYQKLHPNITISYESTQSEEKYWPALQTRLASGSGAADVQGIEVARIADVVTNSAKLWTDLRSTPAGAGVSGYIPWKEPAATTKDGAVLGLGTDIGPMGICYRPEALAKAGLPSEPAALSAQLTSWNDFIALGEKYKAAVPSGSAWTDSAGGLYNAIISTEKKIYYDEVGKLTYATNPAVKNAFDIAAGAAAGGLTARVEQFADPGWDAGFSSGSFATIACPSWMIGYIKGKAGDGGTGKWNVVSLPGAKGGNWGGSYLGIPTQSKNKDEAAKLIAWLTAPEQQAKLFEKVGNFPSTTVAIEKVGSATDPYFSGAPIGKIFSASAQAAPIQILGPDDGVVKNAMAKSLLSVETNGVAPAAAWANAQQMVSSQVG